MWEYVFCFSLLLIGFVFGFTMRNLISRKPEQTKTKPIMNFKEWENRNVTWED